MSTVRMPEDDTVSCKSGLFCEDFGLGVRLHGTPINERELLGHKVIYGSVRDGAYKGSYATLECGRLWESRALSDTASVLTQVLREICTGAVSFEPERVLVAAFGNERVTVDSVGTRAADMIVPAFEKGGSPSRRVCVIKTGVPAAVGLDSAETVSLFAGHVKAQLIICIDSLAAVTPERLGTVIQVTDAGISPGSAFSERASALKEAAVGIPVVAIGVPTVIWGEAGLVYTCAEAGRLAECAAAVVAGSVNGYLYGK